jgi:hypothetical protein
VLAFALSRNGGEEERAASEETKVKQFKGDHCRDADCSTATHVWPETDAETFFSIANYASAAWRIGT